eukprot:4992356-Ditylum_brightwellii.AAC.1
MAATLSTNLTWHYLGKYSMLNNMADNTEIDQTVMMPMEISGRLLQDQCLSISEDITPYTTPTVNCSYICGASFYAFPDVKNKSNT